MPDWVPIVLMVVIFPLSWVVRKEIAKRYPAILYLGLAAAFVVLSIYARSPARLALIVMAAWAIDRYLWQRKLSVEN